MDSDRLYAVSSKLFEYVKSPSLRHIREPRNLQKVAQEIVQAVDRASAVWSKWDGPREQIAKAAAPCWIPTDDLRTFLNGLPGPVLTQTDVIQRLRAIWEEPWAPYPNEELKAGCSALYETEKAQGTELPAIFGAIEEYIEVEEERLRREREEAYLRRRDEEQARLQQRFLAGADCGWTPLENQPGLYCRRNGRTFRIIRDADKRWKLFRIASIEDAGVQIGTYLGRREANKVLEKVAYEPEPNW